LIKGIGQKKGKKLMITRDWEKRRPTGLEGANGKALDPQGISRTTFRLISQMVGIKIQSVVRQWSDKKPYITKNSEKAKAILQTEERPVPFNNYFRRFNNI